ncbi:MAG: hypothetical protein L0Z62_30105 [Gemmataceae bacterium]|nr:hypothetical protein [Gemmataceae bacterium]
MSAWAAFARWVKFLPEDDFPLLHQLADTGSASPTDQLSVELGATPERAPPSPSVRGIVEALAEHVGMGAEDETIVIHDE